MLLELRLVLKFTVACSACLIEYANCRYELFVRIVGRVCIADQFDLGLGIGIGTWIGTQ